MKHQILDEYFLQYKHLLELAKTLPTYEMLKLHQQMLSIIGCKNIDILLQYESSIEKNYTLLLHEQFLKFLELGITIGKQIATNQ